MTKVKRIQHTYLYLDGVTSRDLALRLLAPDGKILARRLVRNGSRTEFFLPALVKFIGRTKIKGLAVVQDGGSFSQARLACAIGNALAYAWGVPALVVKPGATLNKIVRQLARAPKCSLAMPHYRAPAVG